MERIDLNMAIPCFCADYVPSSIRVRIENILYGNSGLKNVREVCEMWESDLFKFRAWGKKSQMALKDALSGCGLHLGMSDKELDDYERYWLEEKARDIHTDTIDWEQRRWELATGFALQLGFKMDTESGGYVYGSTSSYNSFEGAIEMADAFIEEYKKSLNKEE